MHARNRTWLLGSDPVERCRQRTMNVEGGDGSTLSLDFTTGVLDPRLTFTRASNATYINSEGYVTWAKSNLFLQGIDLSNASWTASNLASRSSGITNPFGVAQATELFENTINGAHGVRQTTTANVANHYYTFSVYMKAGVNRNIGCIYDTAVLGTDVVFYTLTGAGTVTIPAGSNSTMSGTISKITDDGWYRCTYTIYTTVGGGIHAGAATGTAFGNHSYAGTTGNSIVMWGGQFEMGTTANQFIPTTTAAKYDDPRFDYDPTTLTPRGLLIEGAATNRALRSNDLNTTVVDGTNWSVSGYTRGDLSTTLPDGTTGNACRISGTGSSSFRSAAITVTASTVYTFSFWARNNGGSQARYRVWNVTAGSSIVDYTLPGSNYVSQIGGANNTSTTWVRVSVTFTTPVGCTSIYVYPTSSDSGTVDVLYWGAQVEAGSGASSYIPTGASQGSRALDFAVISGSNFTPWFTGGTSGTFYADWYGGVRSVASTVRSVLATTDLTTRHLHMFQISAAGALRVADFNGTNSATTGNSLTSGARTKGAFSFAYPGSGTTSTVNVCLNGGTVASSATMAFSVAPTFVTLGLPSTNGTTTSAPDVVLNNSIRSIKYWPTVLSNAQLRALTT